MSPRINDPPIENSSGFTRTEQFPLIYGIKLLIPPELMLSFARSRGPINARFISNASPLFPRPPLLSSHSSATPHSNVIVPPFPSPPIQPAQTSYKVGSLCSTIGHYAVLLYMTQPSKSIASFSLYA